MATCKFYGKRDTALELSTDEEQKMRHKAGKVRAKGLRKKHYQE